MRFLGSASFIVLLFICIGFRLTYIPQSKPIPIHIYKPKPEPPFVLPATHQQRDITVGNRNRVFWLYRPKVVRSKALVIVLHGGGPGWRHVLEYGWSELAESEGFTVAYPIGEDGRWIYKRNLAHSNLPQAENGKDFDFINSVIDRMSAEFEIDKGRVYVTGFSMGGMMSHEFAATYPQRVAAIGPVGGTATVGKVRPDLLTLPTGPVPAIILHGTEDREVPYAAAPPSAELWAAINECEVPEIEASNVGRPYRLHKFEGGKQGTSVWLFSLPDVAHRWPIRLGEQRSIRVMWDFFSQFQSHDSGSAGTRRVPLRYS